MQTTSKRKTDKWSAKKLIVTTRKRHDPNGELFHSREYMQALKGWRASNPLRVWRVENGVTRAVLAERLKIGRMTIYYWETGQHFPQKNIFIGNGIDCHRERAPFDEVFKPYGVTRKDMKDWILTRPTSVGATAIKRMLGGERGSRRGKGVHSRCAEKARAVGRVEVGGATACGTEGAGDTVHDGRGAEEPAV